MVLVRGDVSGPLLDGLVLAHPNLLAHLLQEAEVVRYQHHAALELVDAVREGVNA